MSNWVKYVTEEEIRERIKAEELKTGGLKLFPKVMLLLYSGNKAAAVDLLVQHGKNNMAILVSQSDQLRFEVRLFYRGLMRVVDNFIFITTLEQISVR